MLPWTSQTSMTASTGSIAETPVVTCSEPLRSYLPSATSTSAEPAIAANPPSSPMKKRRAA